MAATPYGKVSTPEAYDFACFEGALRERIGDAFDVLQSAQVTIMGCGGLGSNIAVFLARCGVGHLHLIDFDHVEASNLNRQQYRVCDLGRPKTEALADLLHAINPFIDTKVDQVEVTDDNLRDLLEGADVICEAFDSPAAKAMLVNGARLHFPEVPLVSGIGMAGNGPANVIRTRRISRNFWVCGDGVTDVNVVGTLFAPRVAVCAAHQATIIMRLLLGLADEKLDG